MSKCLSLPLVSCPRPGAASSGARCWSHLASSRALRRPPAGPPLALVPPSLMHSGHGSGCCTGSLPPIWALFLICEMRIIVSNKHPSAQTSHDSDKGDDHTSHSCILSVLGQRDASSCPKHGSPRIHQMARWMGGAPAGGGL